MNRLVERTQALRRSNARAIAPFLTAGDGGLARTEMLVKALDLQCVACIELGFPFSDPIADGPVLQAAADRALAAGTTFEGVLDLVAAVRRSCAVPIALMSYANPLVVRGWNESAQLLARAGVDAWLVPDLPVEEGDEMRAAALEHELAPIFFVAPTTSDERVLAAAKASRGFLYAIGRFGVTGTSTDLDEHARAFLARVRTHAGELPIAVGFGIDDENKVRAATQVADLAIVGSALVERAHRAGLAAHANDRDSAAAEAARSYVIELSRGLNA